MGEPFENSEAWKTARTLTIEVYSLCRREPLSKDSAEKRQAYNVARRSCGEVRSMSYVLLDNKFVTPSEQHKLMTDCIQTGKLVSGLIRSLDGRT